MSENAVAFWENQLRMSEERFEGAPGQYKKNAAHDVATHKHVLRAIRMHHGIPVCWGSFQCVETPTQQCDAGAHGVCAEHQGSCVLCKPAAIS